MSENLNRQIKYFPNVNFCFTFALMAATFKLREHHKFV